MVDFISFVEFAFAFGSGVVSGVVSDRWIWLGQVWVDWFFERRGRHLTIQPHRSITRVGISEEDVLRLRVQNRTKRTIPVQISYGDDPRFLANHPGYLSCLSVLAAASFLFNGTPVVSPGRDLPAGDTLEVAMRFKPIAPGRTGVFVSAISRGFEARWADSPPFSVEVVARRIAPG